MDKDNRPAGLVAFRAGRSWARVLAEAGVAAEAAGFQMGFDDLTPDELAAIGLGIEAALLE